MRGIRNKLPSPAMGVAFVALLAALTGTAVALPGNNSVTSGDIRNGQVKTQDIRNNNVRGKDIRNSTLTGRDVRNNSLTGSDVNEGSLSTVPSANTANSAAAANVANFAGAAGSVDGQSFAKINYRVPSGAGASTIGNFGGLVLTGNCIGGTLSIVASTTVGNSMIHIATATSGDDIEFDEDDTFNVGQTEPVVPTDTATDSLQGTLTYTRPDGGTVTVTYLAEEDTNGLGSTNDCFFVGNAALS